MGRLQDANTSTAHGIRRLGLLGVDEALGSRSGTESRPRVVGIDDSGIPAKFSPFVRGIYFAFRLMDCSLILNSDLSISPHNSVLSP